MEEGGRRRRRRRSGNECYELMIGGENKINSK